MRRLVLPQPLGPNMQTSSPACSVNETSFTTARVVPSGAEYATRNFDTSNTGLVLGAIVETSDWLLRRFTIYLNAQVPQPASPVS
ncbi:MAG: hypothetical protein U0105_24985 [Candidatus Obscuribacterales bacterium]